MHNGYLHTFFRKVVRFFYYTNLIELLKIIVYNYSKEDVKARNRNITIDSFILLKWAFIFFIWMLAIDSLSIRIWVFYLIWTNLFTYFYYHVWEEDSSSRIQPKKEYKVQRRFVNLFLAYNFSNISFAYLYNVPFRSHFKVIEQSWYEFYSFIYYSYFNSLFSDYSFISYIDIKGSLLALTQISITFIFVSIILSKTIPEYGK